MVLAAVPIVSTVVLPSLKKGVGKWIDFGKADKLVPDGFSMLSYEFMVKDGWQDLPQRGFVWAAADAKSGAKVFSSTCSHLACRSATIAFLAGWSGGEANAPEASDVSLPQLSSFPRK